MKKAHAAILIGAIGLAACGKDATGSVKTLNKGYDRSASRVLVREIARPTRANLDYAAWVANMILGDTAKVRVSPTAIGADSLGFGGLLQDVRLKLEQTPLTYAERSEPLAWKPVENLWLAWNFEMAGPLVSRVQQIGQARWGDTSQVYLPFQQIASLYLHKTETGDEVWVHLEFQPWMTGHLKGVSDQDGDGFPDAWAKLAAVELKPEMVALLRGEYTTKVLDRAEAVQWANELAAAWYPVYNTDMVDLSQEPVFPQKATEPEVVQELGGLEVESPFAVIRGRPFGPALYLVLTLAGTKDSVGKAASGAGATVPSGKVDSMLASRLQSIQDGIAQELSSHGGTWDAWAKATENVRKAAGTVIAKMGPQDQAVVGIDGRLLFRRELEYLSSGDLATLAPPENPVERVKHLKDSLAALGIDFLFVPVPTKIDAFPGILGKTAAKTEIVQPWSRKLLADLAAAGVETVDLWPVLRGDSTYRRQDTHWNPSGADLAAKAVARRIREYSWFSAVSAHPADFSWKDTSWNDLGDLHERLPGTAKAKLGPETVVGKRLMLSGKAWEDADTSSILLLGDSYLGVYQKVGPKAAGFPSCLAGELRIPVGVVMGWGGGPEAPRKLAARGPDALKGRRLVVWVMSVRDLFRYPGGWNAQP